MFKPLRLVRKIYPRGLSFALMMLFMLFLLVSAPPWVSAQTFEVVQDLWVNGNTGMGNTAPLGLLQVGTSPTPGLIVLSGGNIGIGTTSPL